MSRDVPGNGEPHLNPIFWCSLLWFPRLIPTHLQPPPFSLSPWHSIHTSDLCSLDFTVYLCQVTPPLVAPPPAHVHAVSVWTWSATADGPTLDSTVVGTVPECGLHSVGCTTLTSVFLLLPGGSMDVIVSGYSSYTHVSQQLSAMVISSIYQVPHLFKAQPKNMCLLGKFKWPANPPEVRQGHWLTMTWYCILLCIISVFIL